MRLDGIFLDLDDTLVAFDGVTELTWNQVCAEYAERKESLSAQDVCAVIKEESDLFWSDEERHRIGRLDIVSARRGIVRSAFSRMGLPSDEAVEVADRYSHLRLENMYLIPGARETIESIVSRRIPLALISNGDSDTQRYKLRRFDLERYFGTILIEGEVGFGKPDRRIYELAVSKMGLPPERTMMVGDNLKWDVAGPQSVGMNGIWFDVKRAGLPANSSVRPDGIVTEIGQILDLLD